jgi:hypothetical protein
MVMNSRFLFGLFLFLFKKKKEKNIYFYYFGVINLVGAYGGAGRDSKVRETESRLGMKN